MTIELPPVDIMDGIPSEERLAVLAHLIAMQARLAANMATTPAPGNGAALGRLLSVDEASARTGMSKSWLYRHAARLPFTRRVGRAVRFDEGALARWLATRQA